MDSKAYDLGWLCQVIGSMFTPQSYRHSHFLAMDLEEVMRLI